MTDLLSTIDGAIRDERLRQRLTRIEPCECVSAYAERLDGDIRIMTCETCNHTWAVRVPARPSDGAA